MNIWGLVLLGVYGHAASIAAAEPQWRRHVVAEGFRNWTAVAADFTGDGRADVITNDFGRTWLYAAPGWKRRLLHEGYQLIHGGVMDVDRDGDLDFIGVQYSPGVLFWLERPADPWKDPWPLHFIDQAGEGGVDGIHGMMLGDIDGDGVLDIACPSGQPKGPFANSVVWFKVPNEPKRSRRWDRQVIGWGNAPGLSHYIDIGDVDGDGRPDVATAAKWPPHGNWFAWWQQPAQAGLQWKKQEIATGQEGATNILIRDLNGDGRADFAASRGHGVGVVWFEAPNWAEHEIDAQIGGPHSLDAADLDGDGDVDIVTCGKNSMVVRWYENDGRGRFTMHEIAQNQAAYDLRLTDLDGDGDLDVLIAGQESANVVWLENPFGKPPASSPLRPRAMAPPTGTRSAEAGRRLDSRSPVP
jgi:hypothetical protein